MTHYDQAMKHWGNHRKDQFTQQCGGSVPTEESKEISDTVRALEIIDQLDAFRRNHRNDPAQNYDFAMRVACAIVAKAAGYQNRNEWTSALKANPHSQYYKDYNDPTVSML